jgi:hypothetical protein
MKHLDHIHIVDALDGMTPDMARHLEACAACRAQLDDARLALVTIRGITPPEPSPLFWGRFAERVNARIDTPDRRAPDMGEGGWLPHALAWGGVLALVLAVVSIIVAPRRPALPPVASTQIEQSVQTADSPADADIEQDEAWAVIRNLAEEFDYDEARDAGVAPRAGSLDRAALELNDAERAELARLIDAELKRIGP